MIYDHNKHTCNVSYVDRNISTQIFTHILPFNGYDIPHTCGPNPKICCQFDFKRSSSYRPCPWKINPVSIDERNIQERQSKLKHRFIRNINE